MMDAADNLRHMLDATRAALTLLTKTSSTYTAHLWSASLHYFKDGDLSMFLDIFIEEIRAQLTRAFNQGARDVGVDPAEFTAEDLAHLQSWIDHEYNFVLRLAQDIQDLRTINASLEEFRTAIRWRIDLWGNRFNEALNEARVYFGKRTRLQWRVGGTKEHCPQCSALDGIVAFAEEWDQSRVRPQHPVNWALSCEGWRCQCGLYPTTQRRSPRALNSILGIVLR